jgi:hypothetical protein
MLAKMMEANGGKWNAEVNLLFNPHCSFRLTFSKMRLESSTLGMLWLPPAVVGYAWVCEMHVNVAVICVMLVLIGISSMSVHWSFIVVALTFTPRWMYTCTLAYLVDANPGRSCTAVATDSSFRGSLAFISVVIAVPLQVSSLDIFYLENPDISLLSL